MKKIFKQLVLITTMGALAVSLAGCSNSVNPASSKATEATTTPQQEARVNEKFTIAYLPNESTEQNADTRKGMAEDLSKALGMEVVEYQASDYSAVVEGMRTGKIDMAYFGPLSFCMAYQRANAEPIGMKAIGGDKANATYKSVFIVKTDSDIQDITDFKGRTIAFVDPESTSGNLVPTYEIMKAYPNEKLDMDILHTNGKFFEAVSYSGKHQAGLQAVLKGDVDIAPISDKILGQEIANGNAPKDGVRIVYESAPIPAEPMAIRGDLPKELKDKVKDFMLSYDNEKYFEDVIGDTTARFVPCTIDDYQDIIDLDKKLNK